MPGQWHSQPNPPSMGQGVCVFRCNLSPALLAEWPRSFACHFGNMGVERTPNKSQYTKLTLEKKILPQLLPGFKLATFRSRVRRSYKQVVPAPHGTECTCVYWFTRSCLLTNISLSFANAVPSKRCEDALRLFCIKRHKRVASQNSNFFLIYIITHMGFCNSLFAYTNDTVFCFVLFFVFCFKYSSLLTSKTRSVLILLISMTRISASPFWHQRHEILYKFCISLLTLKRRSFVYISLLIDIKGTRFYTSLLIDINDTPFLLTLKTRGFVTPFWVRIGGGEVWRFIPRLSIFF